MPQFSRHLSPTARGPERRRRRVFAVRWALMLAALLSVSTVEAAPKGAEAAKTEAAKAKASKSKEKRAGRSKGGKGPKGGKATRKSTRKAPPEPVLSVNEDGVINYSAGEVRALGVGTPKILSPTGDITRRDLYETALDDGARRLARALTKTRLGPGPRAAALLARLKSTPPEVLKAAVLDTPLFFTDGTVHAPLRLGLTPWLHPTASATPPAVAAAPVDVEPTAAERFVGPPVPHAVAAKLVPVPTTGVVLALDATTRATLGIELGDGSAKSHAGLPGDPLAPAGLRWFRAGDPALDAWVGPAPRTLKVHALSTGVLALAAAPEGEPETGGVPAIFDLGDLPLAVVLP